MPKAFLFHGTGGHSKENWFPWIKTELESKGYEVIIPDFPDANTPTPDKWYPVIDNLVEEVDSDSIVIGHSLGGAMALRFLERIKTAVNVTAIISAALGIPPIKYIEGDSPFLEGGFDWDTIRSNSKHFVVFHSDNDPFVCIENGQKAASELGVELSFVPNAGHFNETAGYKEFPELLNSLQQYC
ncbi:MAG: alpha/beta fold hydrolase [Candidatus Peribacteraceae bacterium]|jgi:hypothetical protein|nr:alpha/beta fold hydrolase [Candidatus Peribacteraceae bacterium]MDP7454576.1 alpha/beta fold hydrolase [Candidatus Peribacteraceae bacterium]